MARNEFIQNIDEMETKFGIRFPKGASNKVLDAGNEFINKFGKDQLYKVAKLHFKTTASLIRT